MWVKTEKNRAELPTDGGFLSHGGTHISSLYIIYIYIYNNICVYDMYIYIYLYMNRIFHSKPSSYWGTSIYGTPQMVILQPSGAVAQARANGQNLRVWRISMAGWNIPNSDSIIYPLVMTNIAIEHGHRNSGFSH